MTALRDRMRDADPLRREGVDVAGRERVRATVMAAASRPTTAPSRPFGRRTALAGLTVAAIVLGVAGSKVWLASPSLHAAAVRFEIRLAESTPTLDLQPVRIAGSDRVIYLHREPIVTNDDIAGASVLPGSAPGQFHVGVTLTAAGGEKMRAATAAHIGRPMALLIDGAVVMAPTVRSVVSTEALLTGNYTRDEAERIANGMMLR